MKNDEFFTPEEVDEQIDFLAQGPEQGDESIVAAGRVISHLQQYYPIEPEKQAFMRERAWERIVAEHQQAKQTPREKGHLISMQEYQSERQTLQSQRTASKGRNFAYRFSLLVAVACIGVLIGSTTLLLNLAHQAPTPSQTPVHKKQIQEASGGTPVPKPPHPITGGKCTLDTTVSHPQQSKTNVPGLYVYAENDQSDNVLYRYDAQTKKVVWSQKFCNAFQTNINAPIEENGILYLAGADWTNTETSGSISYLYALNETDGSVIWGVQFPQKVVPIPPPAKGVPMDLGSIEEPTIVNGIVYVVQRTGMVYAFDAATGGQLWTFNTGRPGIATIKGRNFGPISDPSSLQIVNGVAYGMIVDRVYALDAHSGRELWMYSFNDTLNVDNTLNIGNALAIADGTLYLRASVPDDMSATVFPGSIYAFDAQTGKQKWSSVQIPVTLTNPIALNGKIYVADVNARWYTLNPANGAIEAQRSLPPGAGIPSLINGVLYDTSDTRLMALNPDGSMQWSAPVYGEYVYLDDMQGGIIYISGRGSGLYAYSTSNGKLLWHYVGYLPQPTGYLWVSVVA